MVEFVIMIKPRISII